MEGLKPVRVCLVIEGSYPFITGGVSAWVHELIGGLPQIEFALYTFSPEADQELRYVLPPNVVEHRDVVLTSTAASKRRRGRSASVGDILNAHLRMISGGSVDIASFIGAVPEGVGIHRDAILDTRAWRFVGERNRIHNPLYPFADYFWAWKSAHDLVFNVLASQAPKADIYHSLSTGFAGLGALAAKVRRGAPFVLTEHGLYHKEREIEIRKATFVKGYQRDMWTRLYNRIAELCYRSADLCTSLFEDNRGHQLALGAPRERTVVIPNGIDIERYSVLRMKRDAYFNVGFVGRIVPIKDVRTFLVAAKLVLETEEGARFHLIGPDDEDKNYAAECRRLAADLKIDDRVDFVGRHDVREYYRFLDVVVLTSVREAQPLVILEAYAAGIPVVSTDVGNVSELLEGDRRFIAPVKDAAAIAAGIVYVARHEDEMRSLALRNRARVLASYDKKELLLRYAELYGRFAPPERAAAGPADGS